MIALGKRFLVRALQKGLISSPKERQELYTIPLKTEGEEKWRGMCLEPAVLMEGFLMD